MKSISSFRKWPWPVPLLVMAIISLQGCVSVPPDFNNAHALAKSLARSNLKGISGVEIADTEYEEFYKSFNSDAITPEYIPSGYWISHDGIGLLSFFPYRAKRSVLANEPQPGEGEFFVRVEQCFLHLIVGGCMPTGEPLIRDRVSGKYMIGPAIDEAPYNVPHVESRRTKNSVTFSYALMGKTAVETTLTFEGGLIRIDCPSRDRRCFNMGPDGRTSWVFHRATPEDYARFNKNVAAWKTAYADAVEQQRAKSRERWNKFTNAVGVVTQVASQAYSEAAADYQRQELDRQARNAHYQEAMNRTNPGQNTPGATSTANAPQATGKLNAPRAIKLDAAPLTPLPGKPTVASAPAPRATPSPPRTTSSGIDNTSWGRAGQGATASAASTNPYASTNTAMRSDPARDSDTGEAALGREEPVVKQAESLGRAKAWCVRTAKTKFICKGPLQSLWAPEDTLEIALRRSGCPGGTGYIPTEAEGTLFDCGRELTPSDDVMPTYDPYYNYNDKDKRSDGS